MQRDGPTGDDEESEGLRFEVVTACWVGLGGALGASGRWSIVELMDTPSAQAGGFPWATLVVNVIGCLAIGVAAARLASAARPHAIVVAGVLGGFTTMSAVAVELNDLADADRPLAAAAYLGLTLGPGLAAVAVGQAVASRRTADTSRVTLQ